MEPSTPPLFCIWLLPKADPTGVAPAIGVPAVEEDARAEKRDEAPPAVAGADSR